MLDTLQQCAFSFNYSAQRLRIFQAELELDEDAQADWSVYVQSAVTAAVTVLGYLEEEWDGKVRRYLLSIKHVDPIHHNTSDR